MHHFNHLEIPIEIIASLPWHEFQKILQDYVISGLNNLTDSASRPPDYILPKTLKGIFFCLADDAQHFTIHGSLYYDEIDWTAEADYDYKTHTELFSQLSQDLNILLIP